MGIDACVLSNDVLIVNYFNYNCAAIFCFKGIYLCCFGEVLTIFAFGGEISESKPNLNFYTVDQFLILEQSL